MPPKPPKPPELPPQDFATFFIAAAICIFHSDVTPREGFVYARSFLAEAEIQIPGIAAAIDRS